MTADLGNALFEFVGAAFLCADAYRLAQDKCLRGVYWPGRVFFTLWGFWNVVYYPAIGQGLSFLAGLCVVAVNCLWCVLAWRYRNANPV